MKLRLDEDVKFILQVALVCALLALPLVGGCAAVFWGVKQIVVEAKR